jgi:hypothetical protein
VRATAVNKLSLIIQKKLESLDYEGIPAFSEKQQLILYIETY